MESTLMEMDGFRLDYVKAAMWLHPENAVKLKDEWMRVFQGGQDGPDDKLHAHVVSVKGDGQGRYLYIFEVWGPASMNVENLDWQTWSPWLDRVDVRREVDAHQSGLDALYAHLRDNGTGNRNVTQFNTRGRSKRNGRDAGGIGLAIGSHKSNVRVAIYKRRGEVGAMECQFSGSKVNQVKTACMSMYKAGYEPWLSAPWHAFLSSMVTKAYTSLEELTGLHLNELSGVVAGIILTDETIDRKLDKIESLIDLLPRTAQLSIMDAISDKIARDEPDNPL